MTRQTAESTELVPVNERKDRDQSASAKRAQPKLHRRIWRKIASVRWREVVTASIIVMDMFLLSASISLIGVFFPTEVSQLQMIVKASLALALIRHAVIWHMPRDCMTLVHTACMIPTL